MDLADGTPIGDLLTGHDGTVEAVAVGELAAPSRSKSAPLRINEIACGPITPKPLRR